MHRIWCHSWTCSRATGAGPGRQRNAAGFRGSPAASRSALCLLQTARPLCRLRSDLEGKAPFRRTGESKSGKSPAAEPGPFLSSRRVDSPCCGREGGRIPRMDPGWGGGTCVEGITVTRAFSFLFFLLKEVLGVPERSSGG